ncbi:BRCT domain-containing protein [Nocardia cyriacigeorgica]|uniref:BRCT domain-containing protein n=1 Tax=Nocardia cyriacigeorgica TaxID=135487 RepID=UPI003D7B9FDC
MACTPKHGSSGRSRRTWPSSPPKVLCEFVYPGRLVDSAPLVQGMKVAFTGETRIERSELIGRAVAAGLDVTGAVSRRTSLLVTNAPSSHSAKARAAAEYGTSVVTESHFLALLDDIRPGEPKDGSKPAGRAKQTGLPAGPLSGRRVLVLGGPHEAAAAVRTKIAELGGSAAVNMSASTTSLRPPESDRPPTGRTNKSSRSSWTRCPHPACGS